MLKQYIQNGTEIRDMISLSLPQSPTTRNGFQEEIFLIIYQESFTDAAAVKCNSRRIPSYT